jgi:WD40 repeat protein
VRLWDLHTGVSKHILKVGQSYISGASVVRFSPDGKTLAFWVFNEMGRPGGYRYNEVLLCDVETAKIIAAFHSWDGGGSSSWDFSLDSRRFVSSDPSGGTMGSPGNNIEMWDVKARKSERALNVNGRVSCVAFSPDGSFLAGGSDDTTVKLWDTKTWNIVRSLYGHTNEVISVTYSPDGKTLASTSYNRNYGTIKLWDTQTWGMKQTLENRESPWVYLSPDFKTVIYYSSKGLAEVYDVGTMKVKGTLKGNSNEALSVIFSPDGKTVATAGENCVVNLWRIE